jgi:hypothetical protein
VYTEALMLIIIVERVHDDMYRFNDLNIFDVIDVQGVQIHEAD